MTTQELLAVETRALRMLHDGFKPQQISLDTALSVERIQELGRDFPSSTDRRCPTTGCGEPQVGAGRPRKGWVSVKPTSGITRWFCSWPCVSRHAYLNIRRAS